MRRCIAPNIGISARLTQASVSSSNASTTRNGSTLLSAMCHRRSSSKMGASCNDVAALLLNLGALPPNPRDLPHYPPEWLVLGGTGYARPRAIPAPESALGLHLCVALSSAQVLPGWTTSTSPCNDFSANGDYPLNFVSHSKGSLHQPETEEQSAVGHVAGLRRYTEQDQAVGWR